MTKQKDIFGDDSKKLENLGNTKEKTISYTKEFLKKFALSPQDIIYTDIEKFTNFLSDYALDLRTNQQKELTVINKKEILRRLF